jgi:HSP20 family protein
MYTLSKGFDELIKTNLDDVFSPRISPVSNETDTGFEISVSVPGIERSDLNVTLDKNELKVKGSTGRYSIDRTYCIGDAYDRDKISSVLKNGILTITLPKHESKRPKKIEIK